MSLTLRHEAPADRRAAETLVREAFWNVYKPGCDEHYSTCSASPPLSARS